MSIFIHRRGIGLIEIAAGISLSVLVILAGLIYYSRSREEMIANDIISQVISLQHSVHALYGNSENYSGLSASLLASMGQIPVNKREERLVS
jgi:hypothetical protein